MRRPSRFAGEPATTAADIYSLGVVLSELLTGAKPFDVEQKSVSEIVRVLASTAPAKPSELAAAGPPAHSAGPATPRSRGDLDNIVLTAVAARSQARYRSVSALADDVERFLRPARARAPADPGLSPAQVRRPPPPRRRGVRGDGGGHGAASSSRCGRGRSPVRNATAPRGGSTTSAVSPTICSSSSDRASSAFAAPPRLARCCWRGR